MKKIFIAAAIAAMSSAAMAQNVTVYGILDSSVQSINKASATTGVTNAFVDSAIITSRLGFRGSEDLGGGMRAIFQVESDVMTNNGGTNQNGMFRRAAFVGLQGKAGELTLGNRTNSLIVVHGTVMPLAGNSWDASIAAAFGFADFLTKNAITYTTPTMSGFRAQLQHGMSNTAGLDDQGSVNAGHARWDIGNLTLMAAFQDRNAGGTTSSANATATAAQGNVNTNVYGVQYKVTPKMIAAAAFVSNDVAGVKRENYQYGVRYELTPKTSIGGNYMTSDTEKNSLTNLQARYNLSKRTTLYTQYSVADNGATNPVQALNTNTGNSPAVNVSGLTRLANTKQTALGVGIIHSF